METLKEKVFSRLTDDFKVLATIVTRQHAQVRNMLEENKDAALYAEINNNERIIDSLEVKIRNEVINTIVLYSPRASNLRMIISHYDMTAYLERIGDLLLNIAHYLLQTDIRGELFGKYKPELAKMLELTGNMTQNAIFAFNYEDIQLAKDTITLDNEADRMYHALDATLLNNCSGKSLTKQEMSDILSLNSMSYNIERIGDNATNIAEAAIFLIEGKNIKHRGQEPGEILRAGSEGGYECPE